MECSQVYRGHVWNAKDELRDGWFLANIDGHRTCRLRSGLLAFRGGRTLLLELTSGSLLHAVPVISMIRVGRVEERKLGVLTLVLADLLLKQWWVRGAGDEIRGSLDDGYMVISVVSKAAED